MVYSSIVQVERARHSFGPFGVEIYKLAGLVGKAYVVGINEFPASCCCQVQEDTSCFVASLIAIFDVCVKGYNLVLCASSRPKSSLFDV